MNDKYNSFLQSKEWRQIKEELRRIYNSVGVGARCCITGEKKNLIVHHVRYGKYCEEKLADLMFLRADIHHDCHDYIKKHNLKLKEGTLEFVEKHKRIEFTSYDVVNKFHKNTKLFKGKGVNKKKWRGVHTKGQAKIPPIKNRAWFKEYLTSLKI